VTAGGGRRRPEIGETGEFTTAEPDLEESIAEETAPEAPAPAAAPVAEAPAASVASGAPEVVVETEEAPRAAPPDEALERLLDEEEDLDRRVATEQHHETPHFRREVD
jgi:hypothetical protein